LIQAWLQRAVFTRVWLTFVLLVLSFLIFGGGTYNLFLLMKANLSLIGEHGLQALMDGAAQQFIELMLTAVLSMAAYVVFKACEHHLVHWLSDSKKVE
jgi:hypothetical protein